MQDFNELNTTKKGNIGEIITLDFLTKKGFTVFRPSAINQPHPFDFLIFEGKTKPSIVEVKTKPSRLYFSDTGIDLADYLLYTKLQEENKFKVILFFVDEHKKQIYCATLEHLQKTHTEAGKTYPLIEKDIIYFPICKMKKIHDLTTEECEQIKNLTFSKYER